MRKILIQLFGFPPSEDKNDAYLCEFVINLTSLKTSLRLGSDRTDRTPTAATKP